MKKINYKFALLQIIGMILVVAGHVDGWGGISIMTDWFPAYSFHMPLFVFISGYFYKNINIKNLLMFIKNKFKKLVIPYFAWNLIYGVIVTILLSKDIIMYGSKLSLKTYFIDPWINGHQFVLNLASWFVLTLFLVQVLYAIVRIILDRCKLINEYIIMITLIFLGGLIVNFANKGFNTGIYLTLDRVLFLIQFYHLGYLYKNNLEEKDKLNSIFYFLILFIIQFILISSYKNITFSVSWCNDFNRDNIFLPFLSSITGIAFWIRICDILSRSIKKNKIIEFASSNTFTIMMHHMFIFFVLNTILSKIGVVDFNFEEFRQNVFYGYLFKDYRFSIFYLIAGFSIPLILKFYSDKVLIKIKGKLKNSNMRDEKVA